MTQIKLFQRKIMILVGLATLASGILIYLILNTTNSKFTIGAFTITIIQLVFTIRNNKKYYFRYNAEKIEWFLPDSEEKFLVQISEIKKITPDSSGISVYTKNNEVKRCVFNLLDSPAIETIKAYFKTLSY
jgi:hypothetical protein